MTAESVLITGASSGIGLELATLFKLGVTDARTVALAGYRGLRRGRLLVVPGLKNKLGASSVRFVPRAAARKVAKWLQGPA